MEDFVGRISNTEKTLQLATYTKSSVLEETTFLFFVDVMCGQ